MTELLETVWARGDKTGLPIPADAAALREGGARWLTRAFRAFGTLSADNAVTGIVRCDGFSGGGSGTKALLTLDYARDEDGLPRELFVKFSRNFADPAMDNARVHMESEARFAALSRTPGFPVAVPACLFADFEHASCTGLIVTEVIGYGRGGIEPQHLKCLDHLLPEPLEHYRALIATTARLAGTHKAGRLPREVADEFPFDLAKVLASDRLPPLGKVLTRIERYRAFANENPGLLPEAIRSPAFLAALEDAAARFHAHEDAIKALLHADPDLIALSHWNANIDNAWFWRDESGTLRCGLLDWGSVGQLHLAMTLWGCLSGAEGWLWRDHLDELLALFVTEYAAAGGPRLDAAELRLHLLLYVAMMGLCWLMDAPARIRREVPDLVDCADAMDPRITVSETARVQLQMMTNFLAFCEAEDLAGTLLRRFG